MEIIDKPFLETVAPCGAIGSSPMGDGTDRVSLSGHALRAYPDGQWMARYVKRNTHQCGRHPVRRLMRLMRLVPI